MEQIRAFIAVELPGEVQRELARLRERLRAGSSAPVKWVDPQNIHLTLRFLGTIDTGGIDDITAAMVESVRGLKPFPLEVRGLGAFPKLKRVNIIWVGLAGDVERLGGIQRELEKNLEPLGFVPEKRPFSPHLTIGRLRDRATPGERYDMGQLITRTGFETGREFTVDAVHLVKSVLTREGPIYSIIKTEKLG